MSDNAKMILFNVFVWSITTVVGIFGCKITRDATDIYSKPESVRKEIHKIWTEPYKDIQFVIESVDNKSHGIYVYETHFIDHPIDKVNGLPFKITVSEYNNSINKGKVGDTICMVGFTSFNDLYRDYGCSSNYKTLDVIGEPSHNADLLLVVMWVVMIVATFFTVFWIFEAMAKNNYYDLSYILYLCMYYVLIYSNLVKTF